VVFLVFGFCAAQAVPNQFVVQGKLAALPTSSMVFEIYEGDTFKWGETWNTAALSGKIDSNTLIYTVPVGSITAGGIPANIFDTVGALKLVISVDGVTQPDQQLLSVPYALRAGVAESGGGGDFVLKSGDTMTGRLILPPGNAATSALRIGTDVDLYRSAADVLSINDKVAINGDIDSSSTSAGVLGASHSFYQDSASPANDDTIGRFNFYGNSTAGGLKTLYGYMDLRINTADTGRGKVVFNLRTTGGTYKTHAISDTSINFVDSLIYTQSSTPFILLGQGATSQAGHKTRVLGTAINSSGISGVFNVQGTYQGSGTAGFETLTINPIMTSGGSGGWTMLKIYPSANIGTGTKYLMDIGIGSTQNLSLNDSGKLSLPMTGSGAGILIGGDAQLYRSAADTLSTPDNLTVQGNVGVGIGTTDPKSKLQVVGLLVYANNAAAIAGGLTAGAFYRTGGDPDQVCVVH